MKIKELRFQKEAIEKTLETIKKRKQKNIAVEMETGTGKTFTFISTIFSLYKEFFYNKFIIVVPRVAIREGINKALENFSEYFKNKYNNIIYDIYNYQKGNTEKIKNFIEGCDLQILILTKQSFDKENNILRDHQRDDLFGDGSYIERIKKLNPIVVVDEPQLNKNFNDQTIKKLLNPQFILSYSATHSKENQDNIIYKYSSQQAYLEREVKRLEYLAIEMKSGVTYDIVLKNTYPNKRTATIKYNNQIYTIKINDILGVKLRNNDFNSYKVKFITPDNIQFFNGKTIHNLCQSNVDENLIIREQIRQTILCHIDKKEKLNPLGIKVISLFFVPTVADFIGEKAIVKKIFFEEYRNVCNEKVKNKYAYYFSESSNVKGTQENKEREMTKLILNDKEKLISLANQVEFIFAHTSLGIGWDNPNIFNICFLRNIASNENKKQFIGRGLRLCLNQKGERIFEGKNIEDIKRINNLTIIGNLGYKQFCNAYQKESHWKDNTSESNIKNAIKRMIENDSHKKK